VFGAGGVVVAVLAGIEDLGEDGEGGVGDGGLPAGLVPDLAFLLLRR
jgi:hypothetical protein